MSSCVSWTWKAVVDNFGEEAAAEPVALVDVSSDNAGDSAANVLGSKVNGKLGFS
jgi:hypothetical protein